MENSIEKDIEIIEDFILKTDVDYSEYNEQIVGDISYQAIQHLLSAYQEVSKENEQLRTEVNSLKKENEELNEKILDNAGIYQLGFKDGEESYIKKIKDKIEEEKLPLVIVGGRRNKRTLEYGIKLGRRQALQELLESEK